MTETAYIPVLGSDRQAMVDAEDAAFVKRFDWFLDDEGHVATLAAVRMEELVVSLHWEEKGVQPDDLANWLRPLCLVDSAYDRASGDHGST